MKYNIVSINEFIKNKNVNLKKNNSFLHVTIKQNTENYKKLHYLYSKDAYKLKLIKLHRSNENK